MDKTTPNAQYQGLSDADKCGYAKLYCPELAGLNSVNTNQKLLDELENIPNPFDNTTKIEFTVPDEGSKVEIKIFNSIGELIAIPINNFYYGGKNSIIFDASSMSAGLYFFQIIMNKSIETKKMIKK